MRKLALRSNASSANRLSEYYSIYEDDREAGEFWLKVAAESGDCEAVIEIGYRYSSMSKKNDKQISYWRKRMADLRCKDEP